jgi:prepilin-type N-terminal cleavage/methylation domain-containing protein
MGVALASHRGFTLLELVVTLSVIALATAVVVPAIGRGTDGLRARAEVAAFSAFLRRAHAHAVTTRQARTVIVDPGERVVMEVVADEVRAQRRLSDRMTIEADPAGATSVRFSPLGSSSGGAFRLAIRDGVAYRVTVDPLTSRVINRRESTP